MTSKTPKPTLHAVVCIGIGCIAFLLGYGAGEVASRFFNISIEVSVPMRMALGSIMATAAMWLLLWNYDPTLTDSLGRELPSNIVSRFFAWGFAISITVCSLVYIGSFAQSLTNTSSASKKTLVEEARKAMISDDWMQTAGPRAAAPAIARTLASSIRAAQDPEGISAAYMGWENENLGKPPSSQLNSNVDYRCFVHLTEKHAVVVLHLTNFEKLSDGDASLFEQESARLANAVIGRVSPAVGALTLVIHDETGFRKPFTVARKTFPGNSDRDKTQDATDRVNKVEGLPGGEAGLDKVFRSTATDSPYHDFGVIPESFATGKIRLPRIPDH